MQLEAAGHTGRLKLYTATEVMTRPNPDWLVHGLFTTGALIGLYGPPAEGKSFLALDWALSIAQGGEWHGRPVYQGAVVYIAAEGGASIGKRVQAWMRYRELPDVPAAFFFLEGVQFSDAEDVELVLSRLRDAQVIPQLIVVDTLARCFVGGDENSAGDMGKFIDGLARLHCETGAAVMLLHHTGKTTKETERGSTAFRAAADVMIRVEKKGTGIDVHNNKQKDAESFDVIRLTLLQVPIGNDDDPAATSCVLVPCSGTIPVVSEGLRSHLRRTLLALAQQPNGCASRKVWREHANVPPRTLDSHREVLVGMGYVEPADEPGAFRVTEKGLEAVNTAATAKPLRLAVGNSLPSRAAATATTL